MPLWTGRFKKSLDKKTNDFNSSIPFDCRMAQQDIRGSVAHATMLGKQGIIDKSESAVRLHRAFSVLSPGHPS